MRKIFFGVGWILATLGLACQSGAGGGSWLGFFGKPTEEWTILCREFHGAFHHQHCEQFATTLRRTPQIRSRDVRVHHEEIQQVSRLYYGSYRRVVNIQTNERTTPEKMVRDLRLIHELADEQGTRYFLTARLTQAIRRAEGPAAWALARAPGTYSLQIAVFFPEGDFREPQKAAVELVKDLRKEGYDAYYYHDEVKSIVTVGSFDDSAVITLRDSTRRMSPEVEAFTRSDPRFRQNYVNGKPRVQHVVGADGSDMRIKSPSFLVRIPKAP